ncbi:uncharacterized protein [Lepisosteus oculatus]|uniref:uncharacterized protein isoform X1 n=1 Tax=Lepisosteus oculatus TaxID=7918 RepID=UPI0035F5073B
MNCPASEMGEIITSQRSDSFPSPVQNKDQDVIRADALLKAIMSELIDSKFAVFQVKMDENGKEMANLRLRVEIAESELSALRGYILTSADKAAALRVPSSSRSRVGSPKRDLRTRRVLSAKSLAGKVASSTPAPQTGDSPPRATPNCQTEALWENHTPTCRGENRGIPAPRLETEKAGLHAQEDTSREAAPKQEKKWIPFAKGNTFPQITRVQGNGDQGHRERCGEDQELVPCSVKEEDAEMDLNIIQVPVLESGSESGDELGVSQPVCEGDASPLDSAFFLGNGTAAGAMIPRKQQMGSPTAGCPRNSGVSQGDPRLDCVSGCDEMGRLVRELSCQDPMTQEGGPISLPAADGGAKVETEHCLEVPIKEALSDQHEQNLPPETGSSPHPVPAPFSRQPSPSASVPWNYGLQPYQPVPNVSALSLLPSMILPSGKYSGAGAGSQQPAEPTQCQADGGGNAGTTGMLRNLQHVYAGESFWRQDLNPSQHCNKPWTPGVAGASGEAYLCTECGRTFNLLGNLKAHQRLHAGDGRRRDLSAEDLDEHGNAQKPAYRCTECGRGFGHYRSLQRHWKTHTGERPYHCGECGKDFHLLESLKAHQRIHTGERPHVCAECGKRFSEVQNLRVHMRIHSGETPYPCAQCGKSFRQFQHLKRHRLVHAKPPLPLGARVGVHE